MSDRAIEIITGKERRRRWSAEDKLRIVAETAERGARVTDVAARHDVDPSLLFNWRRQVREGRLGTTGFVPIRLLPSSRETAAPLEDRGAAGIEVILPDGSRIQISHEAQLPLLRPVIAALRR
jgi:transposase-like protein